jgi:hypothetical protein
MALSYWIASNGNFLITDNGARIIFNSGDVPPPVPAGIEILLKIRSLIDDPLGAASMGITYADTLPATAAPDSIWTTGDGVYQQWDGANWKPLKPLLSDAVIDTGLSVYGGATLAIARLIAMIDPRKYMVSFNTGGQSITFPSYADYRQHFLDLQAAITAASPTGGATRFRSRETRFEGVR